MISSHLFLQIYLPLLEQNDCTPPRCGELSEYTNSAMGVICKKKVCVGGGQLGYKNIWCDKLGACIILLKVIVALISVSSHPMYTVHAQNI